MDIESYLAAKERVSAQTEIDHRKQLIDSERGVRFKARDRSESRRRQASHGGSTMVDVKSHKWHRMSWDDAEAGERGEGRAQRKPHLEIQRQERE